MEAIAKLSVVLGGSLDLERNAEDSSDLLEVRPRYLRNAWKTALLGPGLRFVL